MITYYGIIALMGYLFGCSNLAFFLGKARGFDIRDRGSNNAVQRESLYGHLLSF